MRAQESLIIAVLLTITKSLDAGVVTFTDINAFRAAAGSLTEIDFTITPDGSPTPLDTPIALTPEFNFTDWGVTFLSPVPELRMMASSSGGGMLFAVSQKSSIRDWIIAEFEPSAFAIGITTSWGILSVFDADSALLAEVPSVDGFAGVVSDTPVAYAIIDRNDNGVSISSLLFQPVPEPATLLLMVAGAWIVARRR